MTVTWIGGIIFYFLAERPAIISPDKYLKSTTRATVQVPVAQMYDSTVVTLMTFWSSARSPALPLFLWVACQR